MVNASDRRKIEQRAYEIYLERGKSNGADFDDWLKAEKEVASPVKNDKQSGKKKSFVY